MKTRHDLPPFSFLPSFPIFSPSPKQTIMGGRMGHQDPRSVASTSNIQIVLFQSQLFLLSLPRIQLKQWGRQHSLCSFGGGRKGACLNRFLMHPRKQFHQQSQQNIYIPALSFTQDTEMWFHRPFNPRKRRTTLQIGGRNSTQKKNLNKNEILSNMGEVTIQRKTNTWAELKIWESRTFKTWSILFPHFITAGTNSLREVSTTTPDGSHTNWNINSSTYQQRKATKNWSNSSSLIITCSLKVFILWQG